ncbi:MAG: hypothetical protein ACREQY_07910, partial [Candidatus Binatia bacterium]
VRAFARGARRFSQVPGGVEIVDESGGRWRVTESALVPTAESGAVPLARLPGTNAFWFGWFGFHPETELGGEPAPPVEPAEPSAPPR